ncbi:MAG: ABC transporter permease [Synechococcus sp.]
MLNVLANLFESRFWALAQKELGQIFKNRQLLLLLIVPPTIQLLIYGFALNPEVQNLRLGIVDYDNTAASRELVSSFTENRVFLAKRYSGSQQEVGNLVRTGQIDVGLAIPPDFNRDLIGGKTAEVQVLIDGVDANTAGIANGYVAQIVEQYSRQLDGIRAPPLVEPQVTFLYNPGLRSSWFFVPGMIGVVVTLISSLVSASAVIREKDTGTLEQLLMTPASAVEIISAKIVPLFVLLMGDVGLAVGVGRWVFDVPFRGHLFLFMALSSLYLFVGIGIGTMLATLAQNQQQVMLSSFFINVPLIQLSGAVAPVESMPAFFRYLSQWLNPLLHYVVILRGIMLKGVGIDVLWPHALFMAVFAIILLSISISRLNDRLG